MLLTVPYYAVSRTIAWAILQNIEAVIGGLVALFSFDLPGILDYVNAISFLIFILLICAACLSIFAAFLYAGWRLLFFTAILWILPGILTLIEPEMWSHWQTAPEGFDKGGGIGHITLGEYKGGLFAVSFFLFGGWSFFSVFQHFFLIKPYFKNLLDHVWYPLGVVSAMIFLIQQDKAKEVDIDIADTMEKIQHAWNELDRQHRALENLLYQGVIEGREIKTLARKLGAYLYTYHKTTPFLLPTPSVTDEVQISREAIQSINTQICNHETHQRQCSRIPILLAARLRLDFDVYLITPHELVEELHVLSTRIRELYDVQTITKSVANAQWLSLLFIAIFAGGKVATATKSLSTASKPEWPRLFRRVQKLSFIGTVSAISKNVGQFYIWIKPFLGTLQTYASKLSQGAKQVFNRR